jgi:hypothetical protein
MSFHGTKWIPPRVRRSAMAAVLRDEAPLKAVAGEHAVSQEWLRKQFNAVGYRQMLVSAAERGQLLAARRSEAAATGLKLAS